MNVDLGLLERWLTGWSLARGLPLPQHNGGGLVVEVGWPDQLRRHVFVDAGPALRACALQTDAPLVHLKAAVDSEQLLEALPAHWQLERPRYLMHLPAAMEKAIAPPVGYVAQIEKEHGASLVRLVDEGGETAAIGRVVLNRGTAVFDRIETFEPHRRKGLGSAVMSALDTLTEQAGVSERLLIATAEGRALYNSLGWQMLAPYSTAVSPWPAPSGKP